MPPTASPRPPRAAVTGGVGPVRCLLAAAASYPATTGAGTDAEPCAHCDGADVPAVSPHTGPWTVQDGERPRAGPDPSPPDLHLLQRLRV